MMNSKLRHRIEEIVKLTDSEVDFVRSYFTAKKFKKHQFLIQESNYVTNDFWEVKGLVKAFHSDMGGKEHIMQFAMEDWRVTDQHAYFNKTKATLSADCLEDTQALCLSLENRDKICAELHKADTFSAKNPMRDVALQRRVLSLLNSNAKERYKPFLTQYPAFYNELLKL